MKKNVKIHQKLNLKGVRCPITPIKAYKATKGFEIGQIIEIETTALMSPLSIPIMIRNTSHELILKEPRPDGGFCFLVRKTKK